MILFTGLIAFLLAGFLVFISFKFGPKVKNSSIKSASYECGIEADTKKTSQIPVTFYRTAILFIIFDIEIIFLYPFALAYRDFLQEGLGLYMLVGLFLFLGLFVLGLWWEIKNHALEWS